MKKIVLALAASTCALVTASPALGQTRPGFEVGAEVFQYGYKEFDEGDLFIRDDGAMFGLDLRYVQPIASGLFFRGILAGAVGHIDYDPLDEPVVEDVEQRTGRFELQLGYDFIQSNGSSITPFLGYGFRLHEDLSGGIETESGLLGYDREIRYHYASAGIAAAIPIGGRKRVTVSGQYNHVIGGDVTSSFSDVDPSLDDISLDFDGGHGLEISAMLSLPVGRRQSVNIGPFVRKWNLDDSETLTIINPDDPDEAISFREPENRTTEAGVRVSFRF